MLGLWLSVAFSVYCPGTKFLDTGLSVLRPTLSTNRGPYFKVRVVPNRPLGCLRTHSDCSASEAILRPFIPGARKPNSHPPLLCGSVALSWKETKTNVMTENKEDLLL